MKISKVELIKALNVIKPGLGTTDSQQMDSFAFMNNTIITYNDSISISIPFESGIKGAVSAKELYTLLNKISDKTDQLGIKIKEGELLISIDKKTKAGIKIIKKIQLPLDEIDSTQDWKKIPKNLMEGLQFCAFSTASDHSKPLLTCIHVKDAIVESTDNYRATSFKLSKKIQKEFLIPATAIRFIKEFNAVKYNVTKSWVNFISKEGAVFSCRVFTQEFPDISGLMSVKGKKMKFPIEIKEAIEKAVVFSENEEGGVGTMIDISLKKNLIIVKGHGSVGWYTQKVKTKYVGDNFTFSINSDFFIEMLKITSVCYLDKSTRRIKFSSGDWEHVLLVLIDEEE